jgi:hypothetical protein
MGLTEHRQAVAAAAADLELQRQELRRHLHGVREAGAQLLTPGRLVLGGLLVGFTSERVHARHDREAQEAQLREPECVTVAPAPPPAGIIELLVRGMSLASAAMPLLMPLIARHTAEQAADQAADNVRDDVEHAVH